MGRLSGLLCALLLCAGCSEPPQKELDTAQGAIDAARAAGADQYASQAYTAAVTALQTANEAVEQRDYRLALSRAIDARERAHEAAKQAADGKARTRSEGEAAIAAAATTLQQLHLRLKAADAARVPARDLAPGRAAARDAEAALQKARTAIAEGNYLEVRPALGATKEGISKAIRGLDEAIAARNSRGARRRR
jgi:Domain of unknown function (DUF4398)